MYSEKVRAELLDGALADHKTHYAGCCRGYYMTMTPQAEGYRLTVNASMPGDPGNAALYAFLERARGENKKIVSVGVTPYRFFVITRTDHQSQLTILEYVARGTQNIVAQILVRKRVVRV